MRCIGAHGDDIEIGCGGTVQLLQKRPPIAAGRRSLAFARSLGGCATLRSCCRRTPCWRRHRRLLRGRFPSYGRVCGRPRGQPAETGATRLLQARRRPFYVFYTPFHLPHIQLPSTIARAVIHSDPTVAPMAGPSCEVVTVAKRPLTAGERLDGIGGFCCYGLIDNHASAREIDALPIALSEGCVMLRDVAKNQVVTFADVRMPPARLSERTVEGAARSMARGKLTPRLPAARRQWRSEAQPTWHNFRF